MSSNENKQNKGLVVVIAAIASTGGLLFGFDTGVISGAIPFMEQDFSLTESQIENVTAFGLIGAVIGALFGGRITDILGRKKVILASAFIFATGAWWSGAAPNVDQLLMSRLYLGLAIGVSSFAVPLYIAEIAPTKIRGILVSLFQLLITVGILASFISDYWIADNTNVESWRMMFYVGIVPAVILLIGTLFLPETPRWLMSRGREEESRAVLETIEEPEFIESSMNQMREELEKDKDQASWNEVFKPWMRNALIIAVGIMFVQQFVGINTVIYYSPKIFLTAGFVGNEGSILPSIIVGVVNVAFTIVSLFLIDKIGRRKIYFIGTFGIVFSLILMGLSFALADQIGDTSKWFLVGSMLIYIAFFAISLGPLGWLIISEVFPTRVRGVGASIGSLSNWGFNTLVVWTFFKLNGFFQGMLGHEGGVFWFFGVIGVLGIIWGYKYIPETKGVSLEEIEEHWRQGKSPKDL